jgi:hypothetical protein
MPSGQLFETTFQIGKETTPGTPVAATRIAYFNPDGTLTRTRDPRPHRFAVGRRDNLLAYTNGPIQAGGSVGMPASASESLELLEIGVRGGVTPTQPTGATLGYKWVYKPGSLGSATIEWNDASRYWQMAGVRADQIQIQGAVNDTNMITATLFGVDLAKLGSMTGALSQRVPTFMEGWQCLLFADAFGAVPGTTQIPGTLRNWQAQIANNLARVYTADNTLRANRVVSGELDVTASLTFDAASAQALAEFDNWDAATKRVIRLAFIGPNATIEAAVNEIQSINTSGTPTSGAMVLSLLGQQFTLQYNDSAATVKSTIETALAALGPGYTVTTTGGPLTSAAVPVTFSGPALAGRDVPQISVVSHTLTGGTAPAPAISTTTPGYSGGEYIFVDIPGAWTAINLGGNADQIRTYELSLQSVYEPTTLAAMVAITCQNNRSTSF